MAEGKPSYVELSKEERDEFLKLSGRQGWSMLGQTELPKVVPSGFKEKLDSAVLAVSGDSQSATAILVVNAHRVDQKDQAIDHEPFAVVVTPHGASSTGMYLHHGTWEGRTSHPPQEFWDHVSASGVGDYFLANPPEGATGGDMSTLPRGDRKGFEAVVRHLSDRSNRKGK